jgi:hypothetical protein
MRTVRTVVPPLLLKCVPGGGLIDARRLLRRRVIPSPQSLPSIRSLAVRLCGRSRSIVRTLADAAGKSDIESQGQCFQWVATHADAADAADAVSPIFMGGGGEARSVERGARSLERGVRSAKIGQLGRIGRCHPNGRGQEWKARKLVTAASTTVSFREAPIGVFRNRCCERSCAQHRCAVTEELN